MSPDSRIKWPKSGVLSDFYGILGVGWPPADDSSYQKSVAMSLLRGLRGCLVVSPIHCVDNFVSYGNWPVLQLTPLSPRYSVRAGECFLFAAH